MCEIFLGYLSLFLEKPPPPNITESDQDPMEIHWIVTCDLLELSLGTCDVRHRTEADQVWLEVSGLGFLFHST